MIWMYRQPNSGTGRRRANEPAKKPGQFQGKKLAPLPELAKKQAVRQKCHREESPPSPPSGLSGDLGKLFGKLGSLSLETEDLLLIAVLYLMYRESGDKELLIMIGALLFL